MDTSANFVKARIPFLPPPSDHCDEMICMYRNTKDKLETWPDIVRKFGKCDCQGTDAPSVMGSVTLSLTGRINFVYSDGMTIIIYDDDSDRAAGSNSDDGSDSDDDCDDEIKPDRKYAEVFFPFHKPCLKSSEFTFPNHPEPTIAYNEFDLLVSTFHPCKRSNSNTMHSSIDMPVQYIHTMPGYYTNLHQVPLNLDELSCDKAIHYEFKFMMPDNYIFPVLADLNGYSYQMFIGQMFRKKQDKNFVDRVLDSKEDWSTFERMVHEWFVKARDELNVAMKILRVNIEGHQKRTAGRVAKSEYPNTSSIRDYFDHLRTKILEFDWKNARYSSHLKMKLIVFILCNEIALPAFIYGGDSVLSEDRDKAAFKFWYFEQVDVISKMDENKKKRKFKQEPSANAN